MMNQRQRAHVDHPAMTDRSALRLPALLGATALAGMLAAAPAHAGVSADDGYTGSGAPEVHVELTPYIWLPATSAHFNLGPRGDISRSALSGIPTASELEDSLHGAFMGNGLVRYGPWSAELDILWVDAAGDHTTEPDRRGHSFGLHGSISLTRVAPGFGYEIVKSAIGSVPVTVDLRAGFAAFWWNGSLSSTQNLFGGQSSSDSFIQPWLGGRVNFYPAPRWRVSLAAAAQGLGVDGGSWGYDAALLVSWAATDWLNLTGGFRAIRTSRIDGAKTIDATVYGPMLGVGFSF
jgi:hypothetical protein